MTTTTRTTALTGRRFAADNDNDIDGLVEEGLRCWAQRVGRRVYLSTEKPSRGGYYVISGSAHEYVSDPERVEVVGWEKGAPMWRDPRPMVRRVIEAPPAP